MGLRNKTVIFMAVLHSGEAPYHIFHTLYLHEGDRGGTGCAANRKVAGSIQDCVIGIFH